MCDVNNFHISYLIIIYYFLQAPIHLLKLEQLL